MIDFPQDPVAPPQGPPPGAKDRMMRLFKARVDALQRPRLYDDNSVAIPAMSPQEAVRATATALGGYLAAYPDQHGAFRAYLEGSDKIPEGWMPDETPIPKPPTPAAPGLGTKIGKAAYDYVAAPAANFVFAAPQFITDIGVSGANIFGADIPHTDLKAATVAALRQVAGKGGKTMRETMEAAEKTLMEAEQTAMPGAGVVQDVAGVIGTLRSFKNPFVKGAMAPGGWLARKAAEVGEKMVGKELPTVLKEGLGLAGGLATVKAVTAQSQEPGRNTPTIGERASQAGWQALAGLVIPSVQKVGSAAFRKIMEKGLTQLDEPARQSLQRLQEWATKNKVFPVGQETKEKYLERVVNAWVDAGAPGVQLGARRLFAYAAQGGIEGLGFSMLDAQFHENLIDFVFKDHDVAKLGSALEKYGVNAVAAMALHIPLKQIVPWQRRQTTPTGSPPRPTPQLGYTPEPAPEGTKLLPQTAEGFTNKVGEEGVRRFETGEQPLQSEEAAKAFDARRQAEAQDPGQQRRMAAQRTADEAARQKSEDNIIRLGWQYVPAAPAGVPQLPAIAEGFTQKAGEEGVKQIEAGTAGAKTEEQLAKEADARRAAEAQDPGQQKRAEARRKAEDAARTKDLTQYPQTGEPGSGIPRLPVEVPPGFPPSTPEEKALIESIAPSVRRYEIPGTSYWFEVDKDVARPSPKLRGALSMPESMPAQDFYAAIEKASLLNSLQAKAMLPGTEISAEVIKARPGEGDAQGVMNRFVFGDPQEAPLAPDGKFHNVESVPARGKDLLPPYQQEAVQAVRQALDSRPDIDQSDRVMLSGVIDVLETVSAENDQSVMETLAALPYVLPAIHNDTPEYAGKVIKAVAEMLTTKAPEVALQDVVEPVPTEATPSGQEQQTAGEWSFVRKEGEKVVAKNKQNTFRAMSPEEWQKLGGGPVEPQPGPSEAGGGMGLTPAAGRFLGSVAKGTVGLAGDVVAKATEAYADTQIARLRATGATEMAEWGMQALTNAKRRRGQYATRLARFEQRANKYDPTFYNVLTKGEHGFGWTGWHAYKDDAAARYLGVAREDLTDKQRELLTEADDLTKDIRRDAAELGMRLASDPDKRIASEASKDVMVRETLPDLQQLLLTKSGPDFEQYTEGLAEANGFTLSEVREKFSEQRRLAKRDPIEWVRQFPVHPDQMVSKKSGNTLHFLQAQPAANTRAMVLNAAMRLGVVESPFGQDLPPEEGEKEYVEEMPVPYSAAIGKLESPAQQKQAAAMLRSLHGIPTTAPSGFIEPGGRISRFIQGADAITGLWKALKMARGFAQNIVEPWGTPASRLGYARIAHGEAQFWGGMMEGGLKGMLERLFSGKLFRPAHDLFDHFAETGALLHDPPSLRVKGETTKLETGKALSKAASRVVLVPFELMQKRGEIIVAAAAEKAVADMRAGDGTRKDIQVAMDFGVSRERAEAMARGEGTDAEYDRIALNFVSDAMAGHSELPVEKSTAGLSRTYPKLVAFDTFFQRQMREMRRLSSRAKNAKTARQRRDASQDILEFLLKSLGVGLAGQAIVAAFKDGLEGLAKWAREAWEEPEFALASATLGSLFGGLGNFLGNVGAETVRALFFGEADEAKRDIGEAAMRVVPYIGAVWDLGEGLGAILFPGSVSPYGPYNGKSLVGKVGTLLAEVSPILKDVGDGLFGISAIALAGDDKVPDARSSWFKWMERHGGYKRETPSFEDKDKEFLSNMRAAVEDVQRGEHWGDEDLMQHLRTAFKAKSMESVARSLRARKMMTGNDHFDALTNKQRGDFRAFLGDDQWKLLWQYDRVLEAMADRIHRR